MEKFSKISERKSLLEKNKIRSLHNKNKYYLPEKYSSFDYDDVVKTNRLILKQVFEDIVGNEAGVVLDGFGYFCIWKTPEKIKIRNLSKSNSGEYYFNPHSNGYFYFPTLFTDVFSNSLLKIWSMDGSFNRRLRKEMSNKLKNGKDYIFMYSTVKSLKLRYKNKKKRKLIKNKKW